MGNVATKQGMTDQTSGNVSPRDGGAKHPQTSFADAFGMKDQTTLSGIAPAGAGTGPDASSPNPLDPEPRGKTLHSQGASLQAAWGQTDGDGDGLDLGLGAKVMDEAQLKAHL